MEKTSRGISLRCLANVASFYTAESVGDMHFYKCKQCPFMTLSEKDIESHWYSAHYPELERSAFPVRCPGCGDNFDSENVIKLHLKDHHKMESNDVDKLVENVLKMALSKVKKPSDTTIEKRDSKRKKNKKNRETKIPEVIEITPDITAIANLTQNHVTVITKEELKKLGCHKFETLSQADVKDIINEASINILYSDTNPQTIDGPLSSKQQSPQTLESMINTSVTLPINSKIAKEYPLTYITINRDLKPSSVIMSDPNCLEYNQHKSPHNKAESSDEFKIGYDNVEKFNASFENPINLSLNPNSSNDNATDSNAINLKLCTFSNCDVKLQSAEKLKYHLKCHVNDKLCCPECRRFFMYVERFHMHLWKSHNIDMELVTCEFCPFKTHCGTRLKVHHKTVHKMELPLKCNECGEKFKTIKQQTDHKAVHKTTRYVCDLCQRSFPYPKQLQLHISSTHNKNKPFKCDLCGYKFSYSSGLKLHMRSHIGEKKYQCEDCEFKTEDHNTIRRHRKRHNQEMTYNCLHCSYSCIQASSYKMHMATKHPGIEVDNYYTCPFCKYKSVNRFKYITHLSTHANQESLPLQMDMTMPRLLNSWVPSNQEDIPDDYQSQTSLPNNDYVDVKAKSNHTSSILCANVGTTDVPIEIDDCDTSTEIPYKMPKMSTNENASSGFQILQNFLTSDVGQEDNNSDCLLLEEAEETGVDEMHSENTNNAITSYFSILPGRSNEFSENTLKSTVSVTSQMFMTSSDLPMLSLPSLLPIADQSNGDSSNNITTTAFDNIPMSGNKAMCNLVKSVIPSISFQRISGLSSRKESNISVKSNLILKEPDEVNDFHSQQKMAFKQLEDNQQRIGMTVPTSDFLNLSMLYGTDQCDLNNILISSECVPNNTAPLQDKIIRGSPSSNLKLFNIEPNKTASNNPCVKRSAANSPALLSNSNENIKMETKQMLPFMSYLNNADEVRLVSTEDLLADYGKASQRLDSMSKGEIIKNENIAEMFVNNVNLSNINMVNCLQTMDTSLVESLPGFSMNFTQKDAFNGNVDYTSVSDNLQCLSDQSGDSPYFQSDVIEIDDTSNDMKLLPHINLALSMDYINNVCDILPGGFIPSVSDNGINDRKNAEIGNSQIKEKPRIISEVYISGDKSKTFNFENLVSSNPQIGPSVNFMHGVNDPMMNSSVRPTGSKLSVKNIETMINNGNYRV